MPGKEHNIQVHGVSYLWWFQSSWTPCWEGHIWTQRIQWTQETISESRIKVYLWNCILSTGQGTVGIFNYCLGSCHCYGIITAVYFPVFLFWVLLWLFHCCFVLYVQTRRIAFVLCSWTMKSHILMWQDCALPDILDLSWCRTFKLKLQGVIVWDSAPNDPAKIIESLTLNFHVTKLTLSHLSDLLRNQI